MSHEAKCNWPTLIKQAIQFCVDRGYTISRTIEQLHPHVSERLIIDALYYAICLFPDSLKKEMICYHMNFVRGQLMTAMTERK